MNKKKVMLFLIMLLTIMNTHALKNDSKELTERNECEHFELSIANKDDTLTKVSCYDTYDDTKKAMNESEEKDLIILERVNDVTKIIDAKYALVYLDRGDVVTYLYTNNSFKTSLTYMNNSSNYGATDGALIDFIYTNKAAKIKIGGVTGWVKNNQYKIVPIAWVKSHSYYRLDDQNISHVYAKNIENGNYYQASRALGPKPFSDFSNGVYVSYDGIYLYKDFYSMLDDYKSDKHDLSLNKDKPYYNYYLFLPHRSKTNYSIDDIDSYIRNVLNFKGSLYGKTLTSNNSVLYGSSEYYQYSEKLYGANALSVFSLSRNESANGRSSIAYNKNNIFGHNAVDGSAYSSASGYLDVRSSIYTHGYGYINYGYARVSDSRYNGSHFGNKDTGMNVMYASDVFWGEKAASYYYSFDKDNGMLDYNYYQLIISKYKDVYVRSAPTTKSSSVYQIKKVNLPFILIDEVEGEEINGNKIWYKIQSDSNIDNKGNLIGSNSSTWPEYNWNGYVYVHSSFFEKINEGKKYDSGIYHLPAGVVKEVNDYKLTTMATKTAYTPLVGKVKNNIDYYYTSTLMEKKGTIVNGSLVVILEKVEYNGNTNYLVVTDYGTNQKAWVSSKDIEVIKKDLLGINITSSGGYIDVYDKPNGTSVLKVYSGNFLPIVDKETVGDKTYLKVEYQVVGKLLYGYVDSSIANISYTLEYLNSLPVITKSDVAIILGDSFNPMDGLSCSDLEDGDLTSKVKITENTVDVKKEGVYSVTYSVTDSFGDTVTKKITVTIFKLQESDALFMYNSLKHLENNSFEFSGFMGIKGMHNKEVRQELIFLNQGTNKEYKYDLSKWNDYPYEMSSIDDKENYDYSGAWFKNNLDLSDLPNGDYTLYVRVINGDKESRTLFTNIAYMDMTRRAHGKNKDFLIDVDYSTLNSPLLFSVRDNLISLDVPKTIDPMYNFFNDIKIENDKLTIKGTSHNVGVSYGESDEVERIIVLENKDTFERIEYDLGSITNGDYPITLAVSDNCDKTKAWYMNTIDLSTLPKGNYVIYIKNTVNKVTYYGEIIDVSYTDFSKINSDKYQLIRNDKLRLRLELVKK